MDMPKSPQALIDRFDTVAAEHPDATRRLTFGYPCLYVGGNMVSGLYGPRWHVKLGAAQTEELMAMDGAGPFEPMPGRPMTGFTLLPDAVVADDAEVRRWVDRAIAYGETLPVKTPKPKPAKAKA